jgi:alkanesulfonate monooxygenase SsuD/methylene tetrahydromethanopterin reductase-like flavin-dependent oxidoreductase (luciferase family)
VVVGADEADLRARAKRVCAVSGMDPDTLVSEPPAGFVVGTPERAAEQLRALSDAGVCRVMCQHLAHDDLEFVAVLGERVAPLVA